MRILMIMAHPDDETIFGWPILQNKNIEKDILCLSDDSENPERKWCKNRNRACIDICEKTDIRYMSLKYDSEFYRYTTRDKKLSFAIEFMLSEIKGILYTRNYDAIFAHNPIGEYGHIDHTLAHIIAMSFDIQIWITDIFIPSNWMPFKKMPAVYKRIYYRKKLFNSVNNLTEYNECEKIYRKYSCWTWSKPPVKECSVYAI